MKKKLEYVAPQLRQHGHMEDLTQGGSSGSVLDATFQAGSSVSSLTFS